MRYNVRYNGIQCEIQCELQCELQCEIQCIHCTHVILTCGYVNDTCPTLKPLPYMVYGIPYTL